MGINRLTSVFHKYQEHIPPWPFIRWPGCHDTHEQGHCHFGNYTVFLDTICGYTRLPLHKWWISQWNQPYRSAIWRSKVASWSKGIFEQFLSQKGPPNPWPLPWALPSQRAHEPTSPMVRASTTTATPQFRFCLLAPIIPESGPTVGVNQLLRALLTVPRIRMRPTRFNTPNPIQSTVSVAFVAFRIRLNFHILFICFECSSPEYNHFHLRTGYTINICTPLTS